MRLEEPIMETLVTDNPTEALENTLRKFGRRLPSNPADSTETPD